MENAAKRAHNRSPSTTARHVQLQHQQEVGDVEEFTCEICLETSLDNKKFRNGDICAHSFCTNCVIKYIGVKLGDDNMGHIKCPAPHCNHTLDPLACAPLVGRSLFLRWCDVLCEAAIMGWERCYCPHKDCRVVILNECGGNLSFSMCPRCKGWLCFRCKTVWHGRISCQENREAEPLRKLAARKLWQSCPSCRQYVQLGEGCPIVRCRCGILFCYTCGKRVYRHSCTCRSRFGIEIPFLLLLLLMAVAFFLYVLHACHEDGFYPFSLLTYTKR